MLIEGDLDELWSSIVNESRALFVIGELEKLLAKIITERIYSDISFFFFFFFLSEPNGVSLPVISSITCI